MKYCEVGEILEDEMEGACCTHESGEKRRDQDRRIVRGITLRVELKAMDERLLIVHLCWF
jgi:hypothetical protein